MTRLDSADRRMHPALERFALWRARIDAWWSRVTGFGVVLRACVAVSGVVAVMLAMPEDARWTFGPAAAMMALFAAVFPTGAWVSAVLATVAVFWAAQGFVVEFPSLATACAIGVAAYVHHASAALAALWRADAAVSGQMVRDWLARTGAVVGAAVLSTMVIAGLSSQPLEAPPGVLLAVGAAAAVGVVCAVTYLLHRR